MRATTGKKLYFQDPKAGPLPPDKVKEDTKQSMARQRALYRGENGLPLNKLTKNIEFVPANPSVAKE